MLLITKASLIFLTALYLLAYTLTMKNERNSSIEILRIFAMVLICICHTIPETAYPSGSAANPFIIGVASADPQYFLASCMEAAGIIGDVIFIVCSSYFLLESKKMKIGKVALMLLNTFIISLIFMTVILSLGYKLSAFEIVRQIFPTLFQNNWFVTYYILFYLIHPLLNKIIHMLDKKALGIAAALLFVECYIFLFIQAEAPGINKLLCFVAIYFIVAYFKYYGQAFTQSKKWNIIVLVCSIVLYYAMMLMVNYVGLRKYTDGDCPLFHLFHINNPIILAFSLSLFNLANRRQFISKRINFIASLSLLFYLIHHNNLFAKYIQPKWNEWFVEQFGGNLIVPDMLILSAILFSAGIALAAVYKLTIERGTAYLADKLQTLSDKTVEKIKNRKNENRPT